MHKIELSESDSSQLIRYISGVYLVNVSVQFINCSYETLHIGSALMLNQKIL